MCCVYEISYSECLEDFPLVNYVISYKFIFISIVKNKFLPPFHPNDCEVSIRMIGNDTSTDQSQNFGIQILPLTIVELGWTIH